MLLTRAPLDAKRVTPFRTALDLHVSCTPPALILSQDQTLHQTSVPGLRRVVDMIDEAPRGWTGFPASQGLRGKSSPLFKCQGSRRAGTKGMDPGDAATQVEPGRQEEDSTSRTDARSISPVNSLRRSHLGLAAGGRNPGPGATPDAPGRDQSARRPANARATVSSSAYSRSAPAGSPWASRETVTPWAASCSPR